MVAKIESGKSLIGALHYNERKVKAGKAKLIMAQLYPNEPGHLSFDEKLFRLTDLASRNFRTKTNTVHLSLNFDLSENLTPETLCQISESYMDRIGFGQQPFLVYQHFDAGHNHIHILTTNVDADGTRISLHNIGKLKSEPARKAIELEFGLVKAEEQLKASQNIQQIKPLIYGMIDTKRAMTNIVNHVAQAYKFTSLPEFNAVLAGYNVMADRGPKETVMFNQGGLRYWALDENGVKTGIPLKASSLYKKPTLKLLNERFKLNEFLRKPFKGAISKSIDKALAKSTSHQCLKQHLAGDNIELLIRKNPEGRIYGLTFIDHQNKVVFNGSDLEKGYSAAAIESTFKTNRKPQAEIDTAMLSQVAAGGQTNKQELTSTSFDLLGDLLNPVDQSNSQNLFEKKKKKKRKKLRL
ncbi:Relaxase/Mobilisation nuclease domain-containing protein [Mucilaginibacter gossypiicola]|uniref:Relaxase/Mobilisation nuclease domain-containing protein n=1 Tax=Mucilaginibacter gossypiicola TaxID=551995 RepID=A0A1H8DMS8_9SPHI|nr:relaxase/mobilization nuclease domain-containing protein [Mucilaginibacter gossypiicola]SEN08543.1 Relaxase/Mobilisation nuclease domain-containing protein [Mucilaginibacter gossypiicola]